MKTAAVLLIILIVSSITNAVVAGDTDRLAECVATADMADAAARSRDAGVTPARTVALIVKQAPERLKGQVSAIVADVYSDDRLTPDQKSNEVLQRCLELEVF